MNYLLRKSSQVFDAIDRYWESQTNSRIIGALLISIFIVHLILIKLKTLDVLPVFLSPHITTNYFDAIGLIFNTLLIYEVISLVLSISSSVTASMLKQLELLSLILLRDAFKTFGKIRHPIDWSGDISQILYMVADSFGAIMIFLFIIFIGRMMRQHVFVGSGENQYHFIAIKKSISIIMILVFIIFGIDHLFFFQFAPCSTNFYETFYTILIFSDILLVLVSLRYFTNYLVVFRNSAFTLATVFIRLALTAPPYINIALGMAASLFVFGLVYFYNKFYPQQEGLPDK